MGLVFSDYGRPWSPGRNAAPQFPNCLEPLARLGVPLPGRRRSATPAQRPSVPASERRFVKRRSRRPPAGTLCSLVRSRTVPRPQRARIPTRTKSGLTHRPDRQSEQPIGKYRD